MKDELISVIIPIYNVEKYIYRCLESVINQTYTNLEIILVDDESPDNCPQICDEYKQKDNRVTVIHKKNGGLSDARNTGINKCKGRYITFVDSDDWLPLNAIEILYYNLIKENADISSGNLKEIFKNTTYVNTSEKSTTVTLNNEEAMQDLMYLHNLSNSASGKLYKKELFNHIKYPVGKLYEDLATTYRLFDISNKIVITDSIVYFYFQNSNSIMHKQYTNKRLESYKFVCEELVFINDNYPKIIKSAIYRLVFECLSILNDMPYICKDKKDIKATLKKYRKISIKDAKLSKKQKLLCYSSYFGQAGIKLAFKFRNIIKSR